MFALPVTSLLTLSLVQAHMQMTWPYPFHSASNPNNTYLTADQAPVNFIDYSMTNPLFADGSNYPCKGYHSILAQSPVTDTLRAGTAYTVRLAGTAVHAGGSCQFLLSYDGGNTFAVIHSVIGQCPLTSSYTFNVPASAPAADKAMLAWSWFNHEGNREMYMNCAPIKITNSNPNAVLTAPRNFRANTFADTTSCRTIEGYDYTFPNPGSSVVTQGPGPFRSDLTTCPYNQNVMVQISQNDIKTFTTSQPVQTSTSVSTPATSVAPITSTTALPVSLTSSITPPSSVCAVGALLCAQDGKTFSQCAQSGKGSASWVYYGAVAPGTKCVNGAMIIDPGFTPTATTTSKAGTVSSSTSSTASVSSASCTPALPSSVTISPTCSTESSMLCGAGGTTFYLCSGGKWINYGRTATGTLCYNGAIVHSAQVPVTCPSATSKAFAAVCIDKSIQCDGPKKAKTCSNGRWANSVAVPAGRVCRNNAVVKGRS